MGPGGEPPPYPEGASRLAALIGSGDRLVHGRRLTRAFYARSPLEVARDLIGCVFWHAHPEGPVAVRLVETEAYRGKLDPGSHGFRGPTPRTEVMFGPPGHLYVYFTYGMHWCVNLVCERAGVCAAVLLRAGEPVAGIGSMRARRPAIDKDRLLAAGPARLSQAMGITGVDNGASLLRGGSFWCTEDATTAAQRDQDISTTARVGLRPGRGDDLPWRFVLAAHPCASRARRPT